jgi:hypothetical protein
LLQLALETPSPRKHCENQMTKRPSMLLRFMSTMTRRDKGSQDFGAAGDEEGKDAPAGTS